MELESQHARVGMMGDESSYFLFEETEGPTADSRSLSGHTAVWGSGVRDWEVGRPGLQDGRP